MLITTKLCSQPQKQNTSSARPASSLTALGNQRTPHPRFDCIIRVQQRHGRVTTRPSVPFSNLRILARLARRILRTPRHVHGRRLHAPGDQALPELRQPRRRIELRPVLACGRVDASGPENLASNAGPRPDDGIEGDGVNGLGPHGHLAAEDELGLFLGQVGGWVV